MDMTYTKNSEPSLVLSSNDLEIQSLQLTSRYKNLKRLTNENGDSYIETPNKIKIQESIKDNFYKVEAGFENRIDLISYKFYGTPRLWWVIAYVNNIYNPRVIEPGIILRIPHRDSLGGM